MSVHNILLHDDPILRKRCHRVSKITTATLVHLNDMAETMYANKGAGLAAPQIGLLKKLVVIDTREGTGLLKMINPRIVSKAGKAVDVEGCLSFPGQFGLVERPFRIVVEYTDETGQPHTLEVDDFNARCVCHEIDHLSGKLFIDKMIRTVQVTPNTAAGE